MLLWTSCTTLNTKAIAVPTIAYPKFFIDVDDPDISIDLIEGESSEVRIYYKSSNKQVNLPLWFWLELTTYALDVDLAVRQYDEVLRIINGETKK